MKTITVEEPVVRLVTKYQAIDGTVFDSAYKCCAYEDELALEKLSGIKRSTSAQDWAPFNGDEYRDDSNYYWFCPGSVEDIEVLEEVFPDATFSASDIGKWICVEAGDGYSYAITLDECIDYARRLCGFLGYEMIITKGENA